MNKQIPMLFSPAMIEALLSGTKTETRRIFKAAPNGTSEFWRSDDENGFWNCTLEGGKYHPHHFGTRTQAGDLIWVRENWRVGAWHYNNSEIAIDYCDGPRKEWLHVDDPDLLHRLIDQSRADAAKTDTKLHDGYFEYSWPAGQGPTRWRPSIHMPKFASRLTLRVISYSIERLHDITEQGAIDEGSRPFFDDKDPISMPYPNGSSLKMSPLKGPREAYAVLWDKINGSGAWDKNPWVSATKFEVIHQNVWDVENLEATS
jgi:hypothetical protein